MQFPYKKSTIFSWSIYDFAYQPFTTLIVTFIYGTFFTTVIAENEIVGTLLWSRGITITALIVAILSPIMGAIADQGGYRKLYLFFWTLFHHFAEISQIFIHSIYAKIYIFNIKWHNCCKSCISTIHMI